MADENMFFGIKRKKKILAPEIDKSRNFGMHHNFGYGQTSMDDLEDDYYFLYLQCQERKLTRG